MDSEYSKFDFDAFLAELSTVQEREKSEDQLEHERAQAIFKDINDRINRPPEDPS